MIFRRSLLHCNLRNHLRISQALFHQSLPPCPSPQGNPDSSQAHGAGSLQDSCPNVAPPHLRLSVPHHLLVLPDHKPKSSDIGFRHLPFLVQITFSHPYADPSPRPTQVRLQPQCRKSGLCHTILHPASRLAVLSSLSVSPPVKCHLHVYTQSPSTLSADSTLVHQHIRTIWPSSPNRSTSHWISTVP